jgi:hypothetical protein
VKRRALLRVQLRHEAGAEEAEATDGDLAALLQTADL